MKRAPQAQGWSGPTVGRQNRRHRGTCKHALRGKRRFMEGIFRQRGLQGHPTRVGDKPTVGASGALRSPVRASKAGLRKFAQRILTVVGRLLVMTGVGMPSIPWSTFPLLLLAVGASDKGRQSECYPAIRAQVASDAQNCNACRSAPTEDSALQSRIPDIPCPGPRDMHPLLLSRCAKLAAIVCSIALLPLSLQP